MRATRSGHENLRARERKRRSTPLLLIEPKRVILAGTCLWRPRVLLVRRENLPYTPTHAIQQGPMKSARKGNCFRLVSAGVVHPSRTITRTKLSLLPFQSICQSHQTRHRLIPATLSSPPRFRIWWSGSNPSRPPSQGQSIQLRTTVDDRCWPFGFSHLGSLRIMLHRQKPAGPCSLNLTIKANSVRKAPANELGLQEQLRPKTARTSATLPEVPLQSI